MYCVYLHRNIINGKCYVGQTKFGSDPNKRWQDGRGYQSNPKFCEDIEKFGWKSFEHIILEDKLSAEQANEREKYWIKVYNSNSDQGYNQNRGGSGQGNSFRIEDYINSDDNMTGLINTAEINGILRSKFNEKEFERTYKKFIHKR